MKLIFIMITLTGFLYTQDLHLKKGMDAPDFTLKDQNGSVHTLSDYTGKSPVVIYFYPKAGTSGCTKQACGIRDSYKKFDELSISVLGISTDSLKDIQKFVEEYELNFPLLSDDKKEVSKLYGVLRPSGVSARYTFIIDMQGRIFDIIEVKDVENHSTEVLKRIEQIL